MAGGDLYVSDSSGSSASGGYSYVTGINGNYTTIPNGLWQTGPYTIEWGQSTQKSITKNKSSIMKKLSNYIKKTVDKDTQELLKAGLINGGLEPTTDGTNALREILWFKYLPELVEQAKEINAENEKTDKK